MCCLKIYMMPSSMRIERHSDSHQLVYNIAYRMGIGEGVYSY